MIEVQNLTRRFGAKTAVDGLSFEVYTGEVLGILGPNGAGKSTTLEIIEGLRGHTSGYAVPTYVVDAPGGGGKIPVMPNYLISYSDHKVVLRNYEGYITTYEEPLEYTPHDKRACAYCRNPRPEPGQGGVQAAPLALGELRFYQGRGGEAEELIRRAVEGRSRSLGRVA